MTLRPLVEEDLEELLHVQAEASVKAFANVFPQDTHPFPRDLLRERWRREMADPGVATYVVLDGGRVAGFAATRGAELLHFGVEVAAWGTGLAGRAHDELVAALRASGVVTPWLRVLEANGRARRFYAKHGWQATGETSRSRAAPYPVLLHYRLDP